MNKKGVLATVVIVFLFGSVVFGQPWDGNGVDGDPYQIWTAADMQAIGADANYWDAHFKLMADIDLAGYTGTQFNIIGNGTQSFTGHFQGNNHTISNFSYEDSGTNYIGLFGRTGNFPDDVGQIRNLTLDSIDVNGGSGRFVGALVGHARGSVINSSVNGGTVRGQQDVGGLIGSFGYCVVANCRATCDVEGSSNVGGLTGNSGHQSEMIQCHATGQVTGDEYVGGLVGRNSGEIWRCYATGEVIGRTGNNSVGGLAGMTGPESIIQDSYARGDVEGELFVGGFLGWNWEATVTNCYSVGFVSGVTLVGGFIGNNNLPGANINCFWDTQSSDQDFGVGAGISDGIYGKITTEMKTESTFTNAGWDFNTPIWSIAEGIDYPTLMLQEYIHDYGGGTGNSDDPFLIYTAEHMQEIGSKPYHWGSQFKLMNDIDLSQYDGQDGRPTFHKIGYYNDSEDYLAFTGVFDGNGCTISNFSYITTTENMVGLFGFAEGINVAVRDLGLINPIVEAAEGYQQIGTLAGLFRDGNLENCYVQDANVTGDFMVGCLVGRLGEGTISHCWASGSAVGVQSVGGLVGENDEGEIHYCQADVSVNASSYCSGGLVGENSCALVYGCSAYGDVNGANGAGGLVGSCPFTIYPIECVGDIIDSYATGSVSGELYVGGLVGNTSGEVRGCSAGGTVEGQEYVGGLVGTSGIVTESYATGAVSGGDIVGGLVGTTGHILENSFATGAVSGGYDVGGLAGINYTTTRNCYCSGFVSGTGVVGGLVGYNYDDGEIVDCFWDVNTSGESVMCGGEAFGSSGCDDSYGKTTIEMMAPTTFTSASWDFVNESVNGELDIWRLCNEGTEYPQLNWQYPLGDFICPDGVDMLDFAVLGEAWMSDPNMGNWNPVCDISEPNDNVIDGLDLGVFVGNWLEGM